MNYERPNSHRLRGRLAIGAAVVVIAGIVVLHANNPGPLSGKHATFAADCQSCHQTRDWVQAAFTKHDFTPQCATCHKFASPHGKTATACIECHREHKGATMLTAGNCNACHKPTGLADHPEFKPRPPVTVVKFNHAAHFAQPKFGPVNCVACHAGNDQQVTFEQGCAKCHAEQIPKNEIVAWRIGEEPTKLMKAVSNDVTRVASVMPGLSVEQLKNPKPVENAPKSGWYWIGDASVEPVELRYKPIGHADGVVKAWLQFSTEGDPGRCQKCHTPGSWTKPVAKSFPHAIHAGVAKCQTCHGDVRPVVKQSCVQCHAPGKVREDCALCHRYHDRPTVTLTKPSALSP